MIVGDSLTERVDVNDLVAVPLSETDDDDESVRETDIDEVRDRVDVFEVEAVSVEVMVAEPVPEVVIDSELVFVRVARAVRLGVSG